MDRSKHTPTPWRYGNPADAIVAGDRDDTKADVAYYGGTLVAESVDHADREFIIRASNSHEKLVTALRGAHGAIDTLMARLIELDPTFMPTKSAIWPELTACTAALAAAEA